MQLASEMGRMYDIEKLTLFRACECYEELEAAGKLDADALIFVNSIASVSLSDEDWASYCEAHSATLPKLVVEITEEEEMNERELERKRDFLGSPGAFALDDYGSGYSNGNSLLTVAPSMSRWTSPSSGALIPMPTNSSSSRPSSTMPAPAASMCWLRAWKRCRSCARCWKWAVDLLQGYCLARPATEPVAIDEKAAEVIAEVERQKAEREEAGP